MKIVRKRDIIRGVRAKWLRQYDNYKDARPVGWADCTAGDIRTALAALDLETCSSDDVDEAIRATNWAANRCHECRDDFDTLLRIGDEPDYEARWQDLCSGCLSRALEILRQSAGTDTPDPTLGSENAR